ncbi:hypothetical protein LC605_18905 [Nostoc sp. CHAB 5836]|uniref:hypothetical protein n=1 Tax=Nostoc sp. CHAB 5836 TaxID=2780404 RepID=UPI001E5EA021|nr:hypothetical protein [Nostoc sp. CHAB 5836]MCC5617111.1 hypothetical protein [Nostoc sp. CHAB 5836]
MVKAEAATDCAKHPNVKAEAATGKAEAATDCAKHPNVKAEAATGKAEAATDCAKHPNIKAEAATGKAEVGMGKINKEVFKREIEVRTLHTTRKRVSV